MDNSSKERISQHLPFGILPSPRRLLRRPAAGILPARSGAPTAPDTRAARSQSDGRGTPRESDTRRGVWSARFHPWCDPLRVSAPRTRGYAILRNGMRGYARIRAHARICANPATCCTCVHIAAHSCGELDGKMCNVGPQTKVCALHCRPYSRFALDGILLCEAGGRCRDQEGTGRLFGEMAPQ